MEFNTSRQVCLAGNVIFLKTILIIIIYCYIFDKGTNQHSFMPGLFGVNAPKIRIHNSFELINELINVEAGLIFSLNSDTKLSSVHYNSLFDELRDKPHNPHISCILGPSVPWKTFVNQCENMCSCLFLCFCHKST